MSSSSGELHAPERNMGDEFCGQLSGLATKEFFRRHFEVHGDPRFQRLPSSYAVSLLRPALPSKISTVSSSPLSARTPTTPSIRLARPPHEYGT